MGKEKKRGGGEEEEETSAYPFIPKLKTPDWVPFTLISPIPEFFLPNRDRFRQVIESFNNAYKIHNLETIFWYCLNKRYLDLPFNSFDSQHYNHIVASELTFENCMGFSEKQSNGSDQGSGGKKKDPVQPPNLFSTYYALVSLKFMGRLDEYLQGITSAEKRVQILAFLDRLKHKGNYLHCLDPKCKTCKDTSQTKILFYLFQTLDLLGVSPKGKTNEYLPLLKVQNKIEDAPFRLLCLIYLGSKEYLKDEELLPFHKLQKPNGGYTFQNSAIPNVEDSFWIGYVLETYKWLLPYRVGPLYSYIVNHLNDLDLNLLFKDPALFFEKCKILILLAIIFDSIINDLETLIFSNISSKGLMDLSILSIQGGFIGVEFEIVNYLNQKYQFTLEIVDNELLFRRFLNKKDSYQQKFAAQLRDYVRTYTQFDITEMRKDYNKGKPKDMRIKEEFLITLIEEMIRENFFTGKIYKKSHFVFSSAYYFTRDSYIDRILTCDKSVSIEVIQREKHRLAEVVKDIFNMTREMENSATNIMHEVESFIIAGDVSIAEERLRSNIKKSLLDASFFNKNIESFQNEFQFIQGDAVLTPHVEKWNKIYSALQQNFSNIKNILTIKIEELRQQQQEREKVLQLELLINQKINSLVDAFDNFSEGFRVQLESDYTRPIVKKLQEEVNHLSQTIQDTDKEITALSHQISTKNNDIAMFRKKAIAIWISQIDQFRESVDYYRQGFSIWQQKLDEIDVEHNRLVKEIEVIDQKINESVKDSQHERALLITDQEFPRISKEVEKYSQGLKKDVNNLYKKGRKLYPLIRGIETEWLLYQNVLDKLIQQMRTEFQDSIQRDLKSHLKETLIIQVVAAITALRQSFIEFEKRMNSMLRRDPDFPESAFQGYYEGLQKEIDQKNSAILEAVKKGTNQFKEFSQDSAAALIQWNQFLTTFKQELEVLHIKFEDEQIIQRIFVIAQNSKNTHIPLSKIAQDLKQPIDSLSKRITALIADDRINALLTTDPPMIEIHNEDWRKNGRLFQFIQVQMRELDENYEKINQFVTNLINNHEFLHQSAQIKSMLAGLTQKLFKNLEDYEDFIKDQKIDLDHLLLKKTDAEYRAAIQSYKSRIDKLSIACQCTDQFKDIIDERMKFLEDMVHSEIHRLYTELQNRKITDYAKNVKWYDTQKTALDSGIVQIDREIEDYKKKIWPDIAQTVTIITDIEQLYQQRKIVLLDSYRNASNDILEKLSVYELNDMKKKMEDLIQAKQDGLNQLLRRFDSEIRNKIRIKDYITAAKQLNEKMKNIEAGLKDIEKEIKTANKGFVDRSKIFGIKYNYLVEKWELFLLDFLNTIQEEQVSLQDELIQQYTNFLILALKGGYVPIVKVAQDLNFKRDFVQNRLMILISDNKLPGKIDIHLDIYIEGDQELDDETITKIDLMRSSNVKAYLFITRLGNVFKVIAPVLTAIAAGFTIVSYVARIYSPGLLAFLLFIMLFSISFLLWIKKGRDRAVSLRKKPNYAP